MKKRLSLLILIVLTMALVSVFAACGGGDETYYNIVARNEVCSIGTQTVVIEGTSINDGPTVKFKQSISPSDIEVGEALEGKKVTKVTYNSETSVTVTLDGNTTAKITKEENGTLTVKSSGLESKGKSSCIVPVYAPKIQSVPVTKSYKTTDGVTVYNLIMKLTLTAGSFTAAAEEVGNVVFVGGATGELSVKLADDCLVLTIKNCNQEKPSVRLAAETTTFGKEVTLELSLLGTAYIQ